MVDAGSPAEGQSGLSSDQEPGDLQIAQATIAGARGDAIGTINEATGDVFVVHKDGTSEQATTGMPVFTDDIVATGTDGAVELVFKDGTTFSLGNNGQMRLDNLIYDPGAGNNGLDATIVKGSFVFITGKVGSEQGEGVSIDTPAGTIGIRGTSGGVAQDPQTGTWIFTLFRDPDGTLSRFVVTNPAGQQLLDQEFETTEVGGRLVAPSQTIVLSPAQASALFAGALQLLEQQFPQLQRSELENVNPAAGEGQFAINPGQLPPTPESLSEMFGLGPLGEALANLLGDDSNHWGGAPTPIGGSQTAIPTGGSDSSPITLGSDDNAATEDGGTNPIGNVLDNDTDVTGGAVLGVSAVNGSPANVGELTAGTYGTLQLNADGTYVYTLNNGSAAVQALGEGQTATDVFTYTVSDGLGHTATATLTITVTGTNDLPEATDDVNASPEDAVPNPVSGNVLANDKDVDNGDELTVSAVNESADSVGTPIEGTYGTLQLNADGTYSYALDNGKAAVQALGEGASAVDTFTYTITDEHGGSATGTLAITVTGTNDEPVAEADVNVVAEDADPNPVVGNVLDNDDDIDSGDVLEVSAVAGSVDNVGVPIGGTYGTLQLNANGTYSYTLDNGKAAVQALAAGETATDTFTYTVADGHGGSVTTTLTITVTGTNDGPLAEADVNAVTEDTLPNAVSGNVLDNDSDADTGAVLAVSAVSGSVENVGEPVGGTYGTLELNADGTYSYTLDNGRDAVQALAAGQTATDVFSYTVSDGQGGSATATLTITVTGTNDAPVAVADVNAIAEDTLPNPVTGNVLDNDSDVDATDLLTVSMVNGGAANVGETIGGTYGTLQLNADGTYSYTLDNGKVAVQALAAGETATDTFNYTVSDGQGGSASATLTITVTGTDDGPLAVADVNAVTEDAQPNPVSGNVLDNDSDVDSGDVLTVSAVNDSVENVGEPIGGTYGTLQLNADGTYSYTLDNGEGAVQALAEGQTATDIFSYTVSDAHGGSATATLTITVTGTNDQPVAEADSNAVTEDTPPNPVSGNVLDNDSDVDATDQLTVSTVAGSAGNVGESIAGTYGTLVLNADGTYSYTLDNSKDVVQALAAGEAVADTFSYTVSDGHGGSATATLAITVTGTDDGPLAVADVNAVTEDTPPNPVSGNVLDNDSDVDTGDVLTVGAVNGSANNVGEPIGGTYGTLQLNADGSYSYALDNGKDAVQALAAGQTATDLFSYTVSDGHGGTATATLTITVTGTNDQPVAEADSNAVTEDTPPDPVSGNVLDNDSDVDATDQLTVSTVSGSVDNVGEPIEGTYGTLLLNADGTYSYTLDNGKAAVQTLGAGQSVTDIFSYAVSDGHGGSATAALTITVTGSNDGPTAVADAATAQEDGPAITIDVLANDTDADANDSKTVLAVDTTDTLGSVTIAADGSDVSYDPNGAFQSLGAGETATDSFTYTAKDGSGATSTATVTVTIVGANDGPTAVADQATVQQAGPAVAIDVLANDTDPDAKDSKNVLAVDTTKTLGQVTVAPDGSDVSYDPNGAFQSLGAGETATDSFTYTMEDGSGVTSTATVTVTIVGANDGPTAVADTASANEDGPPVTIDVLANDSDPDANDSKTVLAVDTSKTQGAVTIAANGADVSYDPNGAFESLRAGETATDSFTYTMKDAAGATSTATVTVTIVGANDGPAAVADVATAQEDGPAVTIDVLANDTDPDNGDSKTVLAVDTADTLGKVTVADNGADVSYDPNGAFQSLGAGETATDSFTYTMEDGAGATSTATVTVTIVGANDGPTAIADKATAQEDGPAVTIDVLANDTDPDAHDSKAVLAVDTTDTLGKVTIADNGADVSYDPNGAFQSLGAGETATDTFTYTMKDGSGATSTATVTVTIVGANDGPTAVADKATAQEDGPAVTIDVLANDTDPDAHDSKTVLAVDTTDTLGKVTVADNGADVSYDPNGAFQSLGAGETATDSFTYTMQDGAGATSTATVTLTIVGANDGPTAVADQATVQQKGPAVAIDVLANDTDPDANDSKTVLAVDTTDTLGKVTIADNGTDVSYDPNGAFQSLGAGETATDTFTYTMEDESGATSTATVTVTIVGANDGPTANADTASANEDGPAVTIDVLANDSDPDANDSKTVLAIDTSNTQGSVTIAANGANVSYDADGAFESLGVGETATDTFTYTMKDLAGATSTATVTVTIVGANDGPTANDDENAVTEDSDANPVSGNVLTNDTDVDTNDVLAVSAVNGSADNVGESIAGTYGTLQLAADGSYSYALDNGKAAVQGLKAGETATESFSYAISDGHGGGATATLVITVTGANDAPVVNDDKVTTAEDTPLIITAASLVANDNDADHDALTILSIGAAAHGTVTLNQDGNVSYAPNADYNGLDSFSYTVSDGHGGTSTAQVNLTVTPVNDPPAAKDDSYHVVQGETLTVSAVNGVLVNDSDVEGNALAVTGVSSQPAHGELTLNANGSFSYTPNGDYEGTDTFTYKVSDGQGGTAEAKVTIVIDDSVPNATGESVKVVDTAHKTVDLVIILDRSGSMNDPSGVAGVSTRLELARAAIAALFEAYQSIADLHIQIVDFADNAASSGWLATPEAANAYLASLVANGGTNYAAALDMAMAAYDGAPTADQTEVYFLSDGVPTQSLTADKIIQWEGFLDANHVDKALAVGIGAGIQPNDPDLAAVAYPNGDTGNPIVVTQTSQLIATLVGTVDNPVSGNVLTNDDFGADGKGNGGVGLLSIKVGDVTYSFDGKNIVNGTTGQITAGATLMVDPTLIGGLLEFHFDTGDYTYTPPDVTAAKSEEFTYVIVDGDGDQDKAILHIDVSDSGVSVVDPSVIFGKDTKNATSDTLTGTTHDDIMSGGAGNDSVSGGDGNDHLQGGDANDSLLGGAGDDVLIGGAGDDRITVGTGDRAEGGDGNDTFILVDNAGFGSIHGGGTAALSLGTNSGDVLAFNGTLDLTSLSNGKIDGIETVSMTDSVGGDGADTLKIDASDVVDLGTGEFNPGGAFGAFGELPNAAAIRVNGETGDSLVLSGTGWQQVTSNVTGVPGGYVLYVHDTPAAGSAADAYVLVQTAVKVTTG